MRIVVRCMVLLACGLCAKDIVAEEPVPVFIYSATGNPDIDDLGDRTGTMAEGPLVGLLFGLGERANRPDVAALRVALSEISQRDRFEEHLGCLFVQPDEECQPIHFLNDEFLQGSSGSTELLNEFDKYGMARGWALSTIEQAHQGGYNLSVTAREFIVEDGALREHRTVVVMYRDLFTKGSDAHARGVSPNDRSVEPRVGSKEARSLYWTSGTPPRIAALVESSGQGAADLLRYMLEFTDGKTRKELKAEAKQLPRIRDMDLFNGQKCRAPAYLCGGRFIDHTEDRLRAIYGAGSEAPMLMSINIPGFY